MIERKHKSFLSLNLKKLASRFDDLKNVLRSRYGNLVVKELRKFEKVDYSLRKCKLDL